MKATTTMQRRALLQFAGAAAEEGITRKDGVEITVKLDSGPLVAVVQEADEVFQPGEKVRLIESGGTTRVSH